MPAMDGEDDDAGSLDIALDLTSTVNHAGTVVGPDSSLDVYL